ncbi:hypothetical protein OKA06_13670 [Novosphingobium sp. MW5]|nr:hypothetical protein [Novosphingobium sp. MW5]
MRDLNLNELEMVYGAGSKGRTCGDSPTPPSSWCGSKGTKKSNKCKSKKTKKSKKSKHSKC